MEIGGVLCGLLGKKAGLATFFGVQSTEQHLTQLYDQEYCVLGDDHPNATTEDLMHRKYCEGKQELLWIALRCRYRGFRKPKAR